jgi:hydrogenase 3 maturation protease
MDPCSRLRIQLKDVPFQDALIVGVGNTLRGDDGVGPLVCHELKAILPDRVIDAGTVPENYIGKIIKKAPRVLVIIDAIDHNAQPGDIRVLRADEINSMAISSHSLSPALFVEVILNDISPDVYIVGIQPKHLSLGRPPSPEANRAIQTLASLIRRAYDL